MKRLFTSINLLFIVGLVFSIACSSEPEVIVEEKIVEVEKEVIKEVEKTAGNLVIYSGRKESLVGPIIEQFQSEFDKSLLQNKLTINTKDQSIKQTTSAVLEGILKYGTSEDLARLKINKLITSRNNN